MWVNNRGLLVFSPRQNTKKPVSQKLAGFYNIYNETRRKNNLIFMRKTFEFF